MELELVFVVVVEGVSEGRSPSDEDDMRAIGNYLLEDTQVLWLWSEKCSGGGEAHDGAGQVER